ncbi:histidine kinase [Saprospiraceae bacterium]|nr:histidine kinase [Saprospiraceae bacterium]
MSSLVNDKMMNRIFSVLRKESATHIIFWSILFLLFTVVEGSKGNMLLTIKKEIINIGFFALIVYLNIVYIFPKYVENKNLFGHLLNLFVIALLITPIKTLIIFFLHNNDPQAQATLLKNQIYIFFSTFLVGLSSSIYSIFREWLRSQREKQELQKQTLTSELRFLKSQINPHFLFNTLNNLYALTLKKSDLAPEIVLKLSEMMRYMLYECNERRVPLSKEVNYLKNYLELEKLRQGKNIKTNLIVQGEIGSQMIAPLMFIPFVENSFKHGISDSISEGYVNIEILISDQDLQINIVNSKITRLSPSNKIKSGGIGLVNIRRRLNLIYPEEYILDIQDSPNEYRVELGLTLVH